MTTSESEENLCDGCGSAEHSIEDCPFESPRVHDTGDDTVLGVLTGQVPVSGPMGARARRRDYDV